MIIKLNEKINDWDTEVTCREDAIDYALNLSDNEIFTILGIHPQGTIDNKSPMFITPKGDFVVVSDIPISDMEKELPDDVSDFSSGFMHSHLMFVLVQNLYLKYSGSYNEYFDCIDANIELDRLTNKHGWVRINPGNSSVEGRFYMVLPDKKLTNSQYYAIEEFLNLGYDRGKDRVLIYANKSDDSFDTQVYSFRDNLPEEIVFKIKRFYSSGNFYENKLNISEAGYYGYSMSNNAVDAYENGEKPMSKWKKQDILDAVAEVNPDIIPMLKKINVSTLKKYLLIYSSWHHTSSHYNQTDFYSVNLDYAETLTSDEINHWTDNGDKPKMPEIDDVPSLSDMYMQKEETIKANSTSDAYNFYKNYHITGDWSSSGHLYLHGRKPSRFDYEDGLENFFIVGEQRLAPNNRGGYDIETWNGKEFE